MMGHEVVTHDRRLAARRELLLAKKESTRLRDDVAARRRALPWERVDKHVVASYSRGLDALNGAYRHLDFLPKGRDEQGLPYPMAWVKLHDLHDR